MLSPRPRTAPPRRLPHIASQQSLWLGLQRSLIVIDTPTLVLGRRASPRWALSPLVVLAGSANSTSRRPILPTSNFSLSPRRDGGSRAHPPPRTRSGGTLGTQIKARPPLAATNRSSGVAAAHYWLGTFNRSNNLVGSLLWYYRACWHQNLAQIAFGGRFTAASSRRKSGWRPINHLGPRPLDSFRACC